MPRVAVDLTPVLPGGDNGGAKTSTVDLLASLARIAPDWEFVLLTSLRSHRELAHLDRNNMRRICVGGEPDRDRAANSLKRAIDALAPRPLLERAVRGYRGLLGAAGRGPLTRMKADLLFNPFLSANFYEAGIPAVTVITDLQFRYYPEFFDRADRAHRQRAFRAACRHASRIICISDYVRGTVLKLSGVSADRCIRIYLGATGRLTPPGDRQPLTEWGIEPEQYLLYPANFWPHKNHERLLLAFERYVRENPATRLKLVCCGSKGKRGKELHEFAASAGIADRVRFPGYVTDAQLAALLAGCKALIFPSLYEGFGMPLVEAMEAGRPVLASNTTSLPEVGGDAYLAFDPTDTAAICAAIARLEQDPEFAAALVARGKRRATSFGNAESMAREYLPVLEEAMSTPAPAAG